jgi:ring-1,2-phenylacetyl-CoA epoxidase subunit PaaC
MENHHYKYLLRLADNGLILSQRLTEWTGHGPFLEEDLALTNIALDILGRSKLLLEHAAKIGGQNKTEDDLAFLRSEREFYNTKLVEQPNGDYAQTIVRQVLVDYFDLLQYTELMKSTDETLAGIAAKSVKEITYHFRHTSSWINRFGLGTEDSHHRAQTALNEFWRFSGELFDVDETDTWAVENKIGVNVNLFKEKWSNTIKQLFEGADLKIPENAFMQTGGKNGIHTEHLWYLLAEMQSLARAHAGAKW